MCFWFDLIWFAGTDADGTEIPCCDVKKTSTGSLRTLAAGLAILNCPENQTAPAAECQQPRPRIQYDLSHFAKDCRIMKPGTICPPADRLKPTSCVSRGQMLIQFNEAYDSAGVPDLRRNARTGKKHTFTDNIHSQILRGSTISQAWSRPMRLLASVDSRGQTKSRTFNTPSRYRHTHGRKSWYDGGTSPPGQNLEWGTLMQIPPDFLLFQNFKHRIACITMQ